MCPRKEKTGSIYLPETIRNNEREDMACVVQSGDDEFKVGTCVYVKWDMGTCVDYDGRGEVRFYGVAKGREYGQFQYPAWKAVLCDMDFNPYGKNVIVKRTPLDGDILTTRKEYDAVAEVVKVGNLCEYVKPGDKVVTSALANKTIGIQGWEDHFLIEETMIYGTVE